MDSYIGLCVLHMRNLLLVSLTLRILPKVPLHSGGNVETELKFPVASAGVFSISESVLPFHGHKHFNKHLLETIQEEALMVDNRDSATATSGWALCVPEIVLCEFPESWCMQNVFPVTSLCQPWNTVA